MADLPQWPHPSRRQLVGAVPAASAEPSGAEHSRDERCGDPCSAGYVQDVSAITPGREPEQTDTTVRNEGIPSPQWGEDDTFDVAVATDLVSLRRGVTRGVARELLRERAASCGRSLREVASDVIDLGVEAVAPQRPTA